MRLSYFFFLPAFAYQILSIVAALKHLQRRYKHHSKQPGTIYSPAVSVLKPLRGLDPNTFEAFVSQAEQSYPEFELLFGLADPSDPAATQVRRLQSKFPDVAIRLIVGCESLPNGKVGVLANLAKYAQYPLWLVNDSDIKVTSEYLTEVTAPLADSSVGVVTCLYHAEAHTFAAEWEALGIATEFMPSALVAQALGVREFGLGSTLVFRAEDLARAGGFVAVGDYLADDYQLAKRITGFGKRALLSTYTVATSLGESSWSGSWQHQLRWARTIRFSKGGGYAGLPITHAGVWIAAAIALGNNELGLLLLALRLVSALLSASPVLRSRSATRLFWLAPLHDVYSFAIWIASYAGRKVRWRDRILIIDDEGRITDVHPAGSRS